MRIELKKFGTILVSRPAGREAYLAMSAYLISDLQPDEEITIDFSGVRVLTPSWADEVITTLAKQYAVRFEHVDNPTVQSTLQILVKYSGLRVSLSHPPSIAPIVPKQYGHGKLS